MARMMKKSEAFSLIEMAVIVIIVGVLIATFLPRMLSTIKKDVVKESRDYVREARDEIIGWAIKSSDTPENRSLPLDLNQIVTNTDGWGSPLGYVLATTLAGSTICAHVNGDPGLLSVQLPSGTVVDDVAFIVYSRGEDTDEGGANPDLIIGDDPVVILPHGTDVGGNRFDDIVEYVTLEYLRGKMGCPDGPTEGTDIPYGAEISFGNDFSDFTDTGFHGGTAGWVDVSVDGEVTFGPPTGSEAYGTSCVWYSGNSATAGCTNGDCPLGEGMRVYFRFKVTGDDANGGYTFAVINSGNADDACGDLALGYQDQPGHVLTAPKLAAEVDLYAGSSWNGGEAGPPQATDYDHIAQLFWGDESTGDDDDRHGAGDSTPGTDSPLNPDPYPTQNKNGMYWKDASWLKDSLEHEVRVDIVRGISAGNHTLIDGGGPLAEAVYHVTVCVDCDNSTDLTVDYNATGQISYYAYNSTAIDGAMHSGLNTIRFGWTMGQDDHNQYMTISDFGVRFIK